MPLISISTSIKIDKKNLFLKNCSQLISKLTKKSEQYVMVRLFEEKPMYFNSETSPCCYVELKSIGSLNPPIFSKEISDLISNEIGIPSERIYIFFEDVNPSKWAWNGKTFG